MISDTVRAYDRSWPWHQTPHKMGEAKTSTVRSRPSQGYGMLSKAVRAPFPCSEHITRASQVLSVFPLERYSPHLHRWHRKHCSVTSTKHLDKSEVTQDHNRVSLPIEGGRKLKEKLQFHHRSTKPSACDCDRNWGFNSLSRLPSHLTFFFKPI